MGFIEKWKAPSLTLTTVENTHNVLPDCIYKGLKTLIDGSYGKHRLERKFGDFVAEDVLPFMKGDFSTINEIASQYEYLEHYHERQLKNYRETPLEVRRLKEETTSYMADKWCYFSQANYYIHKLKKMIDDNKTKV